MLDDDEPGWPLLDDFFVREAQGRAPATVRRYARVRRRLLAMLDEADVADVLGTDAARLLDAERQFHPFGGAFWTLLGPTELALCLPLLAHDPWLPDGAAEARCQVSLAQRLLTHLVRHGLVEREAECALYSVRDDLAAAREWLRDL